MDIYRMKYAIILIRVNLRYIQNVVQIVHGSSMKQFCLNLVAQSIFKGQRTHE